MTDKDNDGCSVRLGFFGVLTIVLVLLRGFGVITCSWFWVFAPVWGPVAAIAAAFILMLMILVLLDFLDYVKKYRRGR